MPMLTPSFIVVVKYIQENVSKQKRNDEYKL